jgi:hypothetical protein
MPRRYHRSHESHRSHLFFWAARGDIGRGVRTQRVEDEDEDEDERDALDQADEVEEDARPEIEHAAPCVANFAVAGGSQETGSYIVIDLLL